MSDNGDASSRERLLDDTEDDPTLPPGAAAVVSTIPTSGTGTRPKEVVVSVPGPGLEVPTSLSTMDTVINQDSAHLNAIQLQTQQFATMMEGMRLMQQQQTALLTQLQQQAAAPANISTPFQSLDSYRSSTLLQPRTTPTTTTPDNTVTVSSANTRPSATTLPSATAPTTLPQPPVPATLPSLLDTRSASPTVTHHPSPSPEQSHSQPRNSLDSFKVRRRSHSETDVSTHPLPSSAESLITAEQDQLARAEEQEFNAQYRSRGYSAKVSTAMPTPKISKDTTYREYLDDVELWIAAIRNDIPPSRRAVLLLMELPLQDQHGGLRAIVRQRVGLPSLQTHNGVYYLLAAVRAVMDAPTFNRLQHWSNKWDHFKQAKDWGMEQYVMEFYKLINRGEKEFGFVLPVQLKAIKLISGCTEFSKEQMAHLTQFINLDHTTVLVEVESAMRKFCANRRHMGRDGGGGGNPNSGHNAVKVTELTDPDDILAAISVKPKKTREDWKKLREAAKAKGWCTICCKSKHAESACPGKAAHDQRMENTKKMKLEKGEAWNNGDGSWLLPPYPGTRTTTNPNTAATRQLLVRSAGGRQAIPPAHERGTSLDLA